jgi:Protein of unknown function (DUF2804)
MRPAPDPDSRLTGQSTAQSITPETPAVIAEADERGLAAGRAPLLHGTRPLKRWRYVGVFNDQIAACAALVRIGPLRQSFWALHLRGEGLERGRTRRLPRRSEIELGAGRLLVRDRGVELDLAFAEDDGIQALCPNGRSQVWTRKQAGIPARGTLRIDGGRTLTLDALAVIDDTAGYHTRETEWWWTAGVGTALDGRPLAWNLVSGVNDPPSGSERAVWVAGVPAEAPPVDFAADLSLVRCRDGSELRFTAEAERARRENLLALASDYRAPFGSFSGELPGAIALARGLGVVEHHRARW